MDLNNLSIFSMAKTEMAYLTERQKVLATNIANANTPHYLPQDVEESSFANVLRTSLPMTLTNEKHFALEIYCTVYHIWVFVHFHDRNSGR